MMSTPTVLYQNLLFNSQQGRGDGTIYAWGTAAVPDVAAKTFDLTTINITDDLGADADDKFNGYELEFDVSGRRYLITDWTAATDLAATLETPNAEDTGDWTMRRILYTNDFAPDNPAEYLQDGLLFQKWVDKAASNTATIAVAMPNLIENGGFESGALGSILTNTSGDASVSINSSSPILGTYDCLLDMGTTGALSEIGFVGKGVLKKGHTYGVLFKARRLTGQSASEFRVNLRWQSGPSNEWIPVTFTKINLSDNIGDLPPGADNQWVPVIETSNEWEEITFTINGDYAADEWAIWFSNTDNTNYYDMHIDEVYVWEIGPTPSSGGIPNPDTLIIAGHNMLSGFDPGSYLAGYRCPVDRSSISSGDYDQTLIDLDADVIPAGDSPIYESFVAPSVIYPIYVLEFNGMTGKTFEAGQMHLGKIWTWDAHVAGDWRPNDGDIETVASVSLSGIKRISRKWERRMFSGQVRGLSAGQYTEWLAFINYVRLDLPFWFTTPAIANRGIAAELLFMRNMRRPELIASYMVAMHASFRFEEVLGDSN